MDRENLPFFVVCLGGILHLRENYVRGPADQQIPSKERASLISFLPQRAQMSESIPIIDVVAAAGYRFSESPQKSSNKQNDSQRNNMHLCNESDWHTFWW